MVHPTQLIGPLPSTTIGSVVHSLVRRAAATAAHNPFPGLIGKAGARAANPHDQHLSAESAKCDVVHFDMDCHMGPYKPFFTTCIIEYSIISAAVMFVLWRNVSKANGDVTHEHLKRKQKFNVDCTNSTKGLFVGLLFVIVTVIGMVIFFVNSTSAHDEEALIILYGSDILLYTLGICACAIGMYRMRLLNFLTSPEAHAVLLIDDILLFVGTVGQLLFCILSIVALKSGTRLYYIVLCVSVMRIAQVLIQTVFILSGHRLVAASPETMAAKPGRQLVTFLLMTNLALFLINTFETQKASVNPLTIEFYGLETWTIIVHSAVPLTIFHRFHSSVCLSEIWKNTYRDKTL